MSKYSSDSDSSDDSRYQKRKSRRSRHSRDESSRSTFGSRSSSKAKHSKSSRDRSRSSSRDRSSGRRKHRSKRRSRSPSKSRSKYRSTSSSSSSNGKSHSRSNSPVCVDSRTTSQTGSAKQEPSSEDQLRAKLQQAIKAAQSADDLLRQQGFLTGVSSRKDDIIKEPATNILDEINSPSFIPKNFVSQASMPFTSEATPNVAIKPGNVPLAATSTEAKDSATSIFHPSLLVDPELKLDNFHLVDTFLPL
ncbi:Uncharacterized protein GBIM_06862 [Gryllus bimaculatus]|nr:Uncharacterized protein GBIM_06862 [Gryllus bimaculatus]